ncbi:sensor histidine kinase [Cohnella yongneupensis]|uniref:histidine kinase n=1 Tax=Cohnella yongneupensis TaxID=425006 RepID=A0ABW0R386_9BACL
MSIKRRLRLSYIAMTVVPIILVALIAATLGSALFKPADEAGNNRWMPAFWAKSNDRAEAVGGIKFMAEAEPDRFADDAFLKEADTRLNQVDAGLVIMRGDAITFASPMANKISDLRSRLLEGKTNARWSGWDRYTVDKLELKFSDNSTGTAYVLSDRSEMFRSARSFFPLLILSLLVVIGLTNGILTYLVSRSFIKPLYALKFAAEQIKEGNLEHKVVLSRKDEIGELSAAFEDMRVRLNESIRLQLQYEDNRKELISNISHDLKTPITGIQACVEGLRDGIANTEAMKDKYIGMISKKSEEMNRLIDELLLFSKLDLKREPFQLERVDLGAYLRDCVDELRYDPRMDGVALTYSGVLEDQPAPVMVDREKLHRVIMNIVDNSLKYMDKEPREISVRLSVDRTEAKVSIQDNGPGIDNAALPHIFERFYRADPSRQSATGGSGLGLAIVKQIIEGQGGTVSAESLAGQGVNITFALPILTDGGERP